MRIAWTRAHFDENEVCEHVGRDLSPCLGLSSYCEQHGPTNHLLSYARHAWPARPLHARAKIPLLTTSSPLSLATFSSYPPRMTSSSTVSTPNARSLLQTLPYPLALLVLRALNSKSALERHHSAYYLAECALKLAAAARVSVWLESAGMLGDASDKPVSFDKDIARRLEALVLPSAGHWCEMLREVSRHLGERKDAAFVPLAPEARDLARTPSTWTALRAFAERAIAEECIPPDASRQSLRRGVLGFFDIVVAYRNEVIGHGAQRSNAFYDALGELLLDATCEALSSPALFGGMELVHARFSPGDTDDSRKVCLQSLTGLAPMPSETSAAGTVAERLYLMGPAGRICLHPLVVLQRDDEFGRDRVGFLNRTIRKTKKSSSDGIEEIRRVDYLDYASGQTLVGVDARAAMGELLGKLRGKPMVEEEIEAVAEATLSGSSAEPTDEVTVENAVVGDFELLGELGRGSMGIVYKAQQRSLRRFVALKVLPPSLRADPIARKRFAREIAALARCDHPNVVKILASGEDNERLYYAMEYVEGADLGRAFKVLSSWRGHESTPVLREGHLEAAISQPVEDASDDGLPELEKIPPPPVLEGRELGERLVELFADAAQGLAHLHAAGIIHRDLKPSNLMLTSDGKRIVIMDLGLAKLADESRALTSADVKILGTLRYMAPEQLQRRLMDVDARADIYSLGAALYELVTGRVLFDGDTEQRLIVQVLHDEPISPRRIDPRISPDLAAVLAVAMAKNAAHRYASATAFAEDLRAVAEHRPIQAKPPSFFRRSTLWVRRSNSGRTIVVTGLLMLLLVPPAILGVRSALAPRMCAPDDLTDCTKQCERGHPGSCFALGMMHENGAGMPRNEARAAEYFQSACDRQHAVACYTLGDMREKGKGGPVDFVAAARWYTMACDANNAQSCNAVARMYQDGFGVAQDLAQAARLFRKSCDGGYPTGCGNLGGMMQRGLSMPANVAEARKLYEKGCEAGSAPSCGNLGSLYMDGIDVVQNDERAASLYKQACDGGYGFGCTGLGLLQEQGRAMPKDEAAATALYKRGCDMDDPSGCSNLGVMMMIGRGTPKDESRARVLFEQACERKDALGCTEFGRLLEQGLGVPKDEKRAAGLFEKACKDEHKQACLWLARMVEDGRGVDKNLELAKELRDKACVGRDVVDCSPPTNDMDAGVDGGNALPTREAPQSIRSPGRPPPRAVEAPKGFPKNMDY